MTNHVVAALDAFAVGKEGKLLDEMLVAQVLHKLINRLITTKFGTVLIRIIEAELDNKSS